MLDLDLIKLNLKAATAAEVIKTLGELMAAKQYVKDSYVAAVLEREKNLPTGLLIGDQGVAIPHTDSAHVNQSKIAVASLRSPAVFHLMVSPGEKIDVSLVFLLAVKEPASQVQLLKNLMAVFQNRELLIKLKRAGTSEEVARLLGSLDL
ncbi:phosphoenolpyruvate-dependent sugar phosphotransferase system eiia 2 [Lucifera butyrica]|uniref:Phosphoenolpyruvate-dependent sugar phosphotransferase system eiia 2 n=1 Tax=Lucifera butyrica TaxID=1351585 RepID=A0A498R2N1_9FIRM|nr:PTS sugar transporter subunit IIA [Lucifera butyrica]VBB05077.1 phosphoenolpyruvate-dependent sugar phosphotransferase system eiia 2 [Lucifera butyrica]